MKSTIKTSALVLAFGLFATGAFAANKSASADRVVKNDQDSISLTTVADCSVNVFIHKDESATSFVTIYNADNVVVLKDALSTDAEEINRGYVFTNLADGDYTIEVTSNDDVVSGTVHVFSDEDNQKMFLLEQ